MAKPNLNYAQAQLLVFLIVTDVIFMGLHLVYNFAPGFDNSLYSISRDRSYAELFQYVKEFWLFLGLSIMAYRTRTWLPVAFGLLFLALLADDSVQLHEWGGKVLAPYLPLSREWAVNVAEIIFAGGMFAVPLGLIALAYWHGQLAERALTQPLLIGLAALVLFGVGGDVLHGLLKHPVLSVLAAIVEDGGEMLAMSFMLWKGIQIGAAAPKAVVPQPAVLMPAPQKA